jgi:predicted nucleic-acid-binding protein
MIAVDTNVLARYITNDDAAQAARALKLLRGRGVFIAKTVLLELEWVLRSGYGFDRPSIMRAIEGLLGLPNVASEDPTQTRAALGWYEAGLDFADALHIAASHRADRFATFDVKLVKRAKSLSNLHVSEA